MLLSFCSCSLFGIEFCVADPWPFLSISMIQLGRVSVQYLGMTTFRLRNGFTYDFTCRGVA